jgi:DNA-binding CsgD family transcriptional regulator
MVQRISSPVFIGRTDERERVAALLARAAESGLGEVILVSGEAGIGKSRFCTEIARRAASEGWLVLRGECDEFGAARPFSPLVEMLPALETLLAHATPGELKRPAWLALQALGQGRELPAGAGSVSRLAYDLFRRVAAVQPLLVILDDLHWADESSRELFALLARAGATSKMVLAGAYRGNEVSSGHPLRPILATVHRNARPEIIELRPFDDEDVAGLIRALNRDEESGASVDALVERSGGNAFFLEELLASPDEGVPPGAKEVALARVAALGGDAQAVAEAASLDSTSRIDVIEAVSGLPTARCAQAIDALLAAGVLAVRGDDLRFRHALIREAVYEQISPMRRGQLHERFALALEESGRGLPSMLALHWCRTPNKRRALEGSFAAARYSVSLGALPEAADWYEAAVALWSDVPDAAARIGRTFGNLLLETERALSSCGRFDRIVEVLQAHITRAEELSNAERVELWLQLSFRAWQASGNETVTMPLSDAAFRAARVAMTEKMANRDKVKVLSLFISHALQRYGLEAEADEAFQAITRIIALDPSADQPRAHVARNWIALHQGDTSVGAAIASYPVVPRGRLTEGIGSGLLRALGLHELNVAFSLGQLGAIVESGQLLQAAFPVEAMVAASLTSLGRWSEALERWQATKALVGSDAVRDWSTLVVQCWGDLFVRSGHPEDAAFHLQIAAREAYPYAMHPFLGPMALVRVELARVGRDADAVRQAVADSIDLVRGHHAASLGEPVAYAIGLLADLADPATPDPDALAEIDHWFDRLQTCLAFAPGRVNLWDLGLFMDQAHAERVRLLGEDRVETWEDLVERWHDLSRPYHEAYCRLRAASALLMAPAAGERKARRARAAAHLREAARIAESLGAPYLADDIERLQSASNLRSLEPKPVGPKPRPIVLGPVLTARELEVLRLVAAGQSNGQIAIRLGISVKTASVHVSNILRKLGAENRVEAAVRATRMQVAGLR